MSNDNLMRGKVRNCTVKWTTPQRAVYIYAQYKMHDNIKTVHKVATVQWTPSECAVNLRSIKMKYCFSLTSYT